jgi:hypothetical protein
MATGAEVRVAATEAAGQGEGEVREAVAVLAAVGAASSAPIGRAGVTASAKRGEKCLAGAPGGP